MKYLTLIFTLLLFSISCIAQNDPSNIIEIETENWLNLSAEIININEEEIVCHSVEVLPKFPGGWDSLANYMMRTLEYPVKAVEDSIEGRVVTTFDIDTIGNVVNVRTFEGLRDDLDSACITAISSLPQWIPAQIKKESLTYVRFYFPIRFKLE